MPCGRGAGGDGHRQEGGEWKLRTGKGSGEIGARIAVAGVGREAVQFVRGKARIVQSFEDRFAGQLELGPILNPSPFGIFRLPNAYDTGLISCFPSHFLVYLHLWLFALDGLILVCCLAVFAMNR